jgi:hypothetical protein
MKALTIRQPWAWAILHAGKDIENRNWPTRLRGRIAVHAASSLRRAEYFDFLEYYGALVGSWGVPDVIVPAHEALSLGAIVGTVEIVDCVSESASPWFMGDFGFVLRNPVVLPEPIPCKGALGFWEVPK